MSSERKRGIIRLPRGLQERNNNFGSQHLESEENLVGRRGEILRARTFEAKGAKSEHAARKLYRENTSRRLKHESTLVEARSNQLHQLEKEREGESEKDMAPSEKKVGKTRQAMLSSEKREWQPGIVRVP